MSESQNYTLRQVDGFLQLIQRRHQEEQKSVAFATRMGHHGDDKTFKKFIEAAPKDG